MKGHRDKHSQSLNIIEKKQRLLNDLLQCSKWHDRSTKFWPWISGAYSILWRKAIAGTNNGKVVLIYETNSCWTECNCVKTCDARKHQSVLQGPWLKKLWYSYSVMFVFTRSFNVWITRHEHTTLLVNVPNSIAE